MAKTVDERARVERRHRSERQNFTGAHVKDHRAGARLHAQALVHIALQVEIEGQLDVVARLAVLAVQRLDLAAQRVDLEPNQACPAAQLAVVDLLDAVLADPELGQLEQRVAGQLLLRDRRHVAEHMRGDVAQRIVADQAGDQGHAGQVRAVDRDARDFRPVEILAHRERHERTARLHLGDHLLDALLGQGDQTAQRLESRVQIGGLLAHHQDAVGGAVAGERHAIAVEDAPAIGRHEAVVDPVLVGEQRVLVGIDRLQVIEAPGERAEQGQLGAAKQQRPARERPHPLRVTVHGSAAVCGGAPGRAAG